MKQQIMQEYASETAICKGEMQNRKIIADLGYFWHSVNTLHWVSLGNSDNTDKKCKQKKCTETSFV